MEISKTLAIFLVMAFTVTIFTGCVGKKVEEPDPFIEKWKDKESSSIGISPSYRTNEARLLLSETDKTFKDELSQAHDLDSAVDLASMMKPLPKTKLTMKMHNVEIPVVLRALARAANIGIVINSSIKGKVSISISNGKWDEVFKSILKSLFLTYKWDGDVLRIITVSDMESDVQLLVAKEKAAAIKRQLEKIQPMETRIVKIDFSDANLLKENLTPFLTSLGKDEILGSITVDTYTNSLLIQAIKTDMEKILPVIQELDRPTKQVMIKAYIVDAQRTTARYLGVQWGGSGKFNTGTNSNQYIYPGSSTGILGNNLDTAIAPTTANAISNLPSALATAATMSGLSLGYAFERVGETLLTVQLSALQQDGKVNILSSPSITTLDNQKATIESGTDIPYQTVENGETSISYKKAVIKLEVTPHIIGDDILKLNIITSKDDVDTTNTVSGNPFIYTKSAETNVILKNGEITVIAGMSNEEIRSADDGVPGLADLPVLGVLFKQTGRQKISSELLIFIIPQILDEGKYTAKKLKETTISE